MPFAPVDIRAVSFDAPKFDTSTKEGKNKAISYLYADEEAANKFAPVDVRAINFDKPEVQKPSTAMDTAKSIGSNLVEGGAALAMTVPNLINSAVAGPQLLGRGIAENVDSVIGIEPQPRGELWQPFYSSNEVVDRAGLSYEPQTTTGKAVAFPSQIAGSLLAAKGIQMAKPGLDRLSADTSSGKAPTAPQATADDIKVMSHNAYAKAEQAGGILKPNVTNKFLDDVKKLAPQTAEGKLLAGDSAFTKNAALLQNLRDRPITLKAAQEIDEILGDKIDDFVDRQTGILSKEGKKLLDVQSSFRKSLDEAGDLDVVGGRAGLDAWQQGKKLWSSAAKLRDVEKIITRAELTDNPATAIKTGFRNLYINKARMRGFSDDEAKLIKKAAETGIIADSLRSLGSRLIPAITAATGGGLGGTAAAQAASMASRGAATKLQVGRANKVANAIANNANKIQAPNVSSPLHVREALAAPLIDQPLMLTDRSELLRKAMSLPPTEARKLLQNK